MKYLGVDVVGKCADLSIGSRLVNAFWGLLDAYTFKRLAEIRNKQDNENEPEEPEEIDPPVRIIDGTTIPTNNGSTYANAYDLGDLDMTIIVENPPVRMLRFNLLTTGDAGARAVFSDIVNNNPTGTGMFRLVRFDQNLSNGTWQTVVLVTVLWNTIGQNDVIISFDGQPAGIYGVIYIALSTVGTVGTITITPPVTPQ
jgi:hypothetical protein